MINSVLLRNIGVTFFLSLFVVLNINSAVANELPAKAKSAVHDSDHDGVPDNRDKCPGTTQLRKVDPNSKYAVVYNKERLSSTPMSVPVDADGCDRDSDGDGVVDYKDYCPEDTAKQLSKGIAPNGCPKHSDKDGTPDYRDQCPGTPAGTKTDNKGCPL
jgi:hypothetical protein